MMISRLKHDVWCLVWCCRLREKNSENLITKRDVSTNEPRTTTRGKVAEGSLCACASLPFPLLYILRPPPVFNCNQLTKYIYYIFITDIAASSQEQVDYLMVEKERLRADMAMSQVAGREAEDHRQPTSCFR